MKILSILIVGILVSGCAVKKDDNFLVAGLKHTVNSPIYLGAILEGALIVAIATPLYLVEKISGKELSDLEKKAAEGDSVAQKKLGDIYYFKKKEYKKAFQMYEKLAKKGNSHAQNMLGIMYRFGKGVKKDAVKSEQWYVRSVAQENIYAMNNLGHLYMTGDKGIEKNYKKAFKLLTSSSQAGDDSATCNLGLMYENGYGVKKDTEYAIDLYKKSADKGNKVAKKKLISLSKSIS